MTQRQAPESSVSKPKPVVAVRPKALRKMLGRGARRRQAVDESMETLPRATPWSKRVTDVTLVLLSAPLWLPLVGVIALVIRVDSKGPAFFVQPRFGRYGEQFKLLKFRTMVPDADARLHAHLAACSQRTAEWERNAKLRHDPRVTRVGRLLRRLSLDELPQMVNVLRGDMSLVGPRPVPVDEREKYGEAFDLYCRVRPGLTGPWQVNGRNELPYERRKGLDKAYVRGRTFRGDMLIIAKTFGAVLSRRGAY
ncbi:MAG: sugar transferase [Algisphaera sp.]